MFSEPPSGAEDVEDSDCDCCEDGDTRFISCEFSGGIRFNGVDPPNIDILNGGNMGNDIGIGIARAAWSDFKSAPGRNKVFSICPLESTSDCDRLRLEATDVDCRVDLTGEGDTLGDLELEFLIFFR